MESNLCSYSELEKLEKIEKIEKRTKIIVLFGKHRNCNSQGKSPGVTLVYRKLFQKQFLE
jgi:hypothetical protein